MNEEGEVVSLACALFFSSESIRTLKMTLCVFLIGTGQCSFRISGTKRKGLLTKGWRVFGRHTVHGLVQAVTKHASDVEIQHWVTRMHNQGRRSNCAREKRA